jgi:hypothetical protein
MLRPTLPTGLVSGYGWKAVDHPSNSSYLTHSDFHLFGPLEKHLSGKRFATDADVKQAVISWLHVLDADFVYTS